MYVINIHIFQPTSQKRNQKLKAKQSSLSILDTALNSH